MNFEKHLKGQIFMAIAYLVIGAFALITLTILLIAGKLEGKLAGIFGGLTFGFLPLGIGLIVDYYRVKRNPDKWKKQIEFKNGERNIYLNMKSGSTAFWIIYYVILFLTFLTMLVEISSRLLFPILLLVMTIVFYLLMGIYNRKN